MDSLLFCETSVTKSQTESKGNRKWDFKKTNGSVFYITNGNKVFRHGWKKKK